MNRPDILCCNPADAALAVPGSTFDRKCANCGRTVILAPSGAAFLRKHPEVQIWCIPCAKELPQFREAEYAASEDVREWEQKAMRPNLYRGRN